MRIGVMVMWVFAVAVYLLDDAPTLPTTRTTTTRMISICVVGLCCHAMSMQRRQQFGGVTKVAEMTGRSRRLVKDPTTSKITYQTRAGNGISLEDVNREEQKAFQVGHTALDFSAFNPLPPSHHCRQNSSSDRLPPFETPFDTSPVVVRIGEIVTSGNSLSSPSLSLSSSSSMLPPSCHCCRFPLQSNRKVVAIISEAASQGISLHSERGRDVGVSLICDATEAPHDSLGAPLVTTPPFRLPRQTPQSKCPFTPLSAKGTLFSARCWRLDVAASSTWPAVF